MNKSAFFVPVMAVVIACAGVQSSRAEDPAARTRFPSRNQPQPKVDEYYYYTPTGSHIPEKVRKSVYLTDSRLPLTVLDRSDLYRLGGGESSLGGTLGKLPYVYTRGGR